MLNAYSVDALAIRASGGRDEWGEPEPTVDYRVRGYIVWERKIVRDIKGEEVMSPVHVYLHLRNIEATIGRALTNEDRVVIDSRDRAILAIHRPKSFGSPHYEIYLA